jgi:non-homologous end joining protein Ku
MLDLAKYIVETKAGHFDPMRFEDHFETTLQDLLEKKKRPQLTAIVAARNISHIGKLRTPASCILEETT